MTQWSCYCIGESVCYWLEKGDSMDTWRWRIKLIKSERCYWMLASLYKKYNTFSDREREQQHRTITFAELPNHPLLLTIIQFKRTRYSQDDFLTLSLRSVSILFQNHPQRITSAEKLLTNLIAQLVERWTALCFQLVRVQIPLESTVFLLTLAVLENHEIFSPWCFSENYSEINKIV